MQQTYYDIYNEIKERYKILDFNSVKINDIQNAITTPGPGERSLLSLISPRAEEMLEEMANRAHGLTLQNFGRTIQLYTPIYVSNYCVNQCLYCGFNVHNSIPRKKLEIDEVEREAQYIYGTGIRHVLLLTGESREMSPLSYIKECVGVLKKYFNSICIEIYPLDEEEYKELIEEGVDGLTIYQEVYDEKVYAEVHPNGPKGNYKYRMEAPERAAKHGMRTINIGALLGLNDWRKEIFMAALHAKYLQDKFPETEISISLPRIRPHTGSFQPHEQVSDKNIVQAIIALRIFLPRVGITISTRENSLFRENILPLGVTRISAGSTTAVGGHTLELKEKNTSQFEISDDRDVETIKELLLRKGYQPVLKDWVGAA